MVRRDLVNRWGLAFPPFPKREKMSTCRPLNTASYVWNHNTFSCILPGCGSYQGADYPLTPALIQILVTHGFPLVFPKSVTERV